MHRPEEESQAQVHWGENRGRPAGTAAKGGIHTGLREAVQEGLQQEVPTLKKSKVEF